MKAIKERDTGKGYGKSFIIKKKPVKKDLTPQSPQDGYGSGGTYDGMVLAPASINAPTNNNSSTVIALASANSASDKYDLKAKRVGRGSDIRLKENIQLIKEGKDDNPNIYSFNYKKDKNTKWKGVMAQELIGTKYSDAVITDAEGFYMVDYTRLGFPMVKISE